VCCEYVREVVMECGKLYCFEGSEALSRLGLQSAAVPVLEKVSVEKVSVEKKGRPKKSKKELEVQGEDLFAELILSAQNAVESPLVCVPEVLSPPLVKVEVEEKVVVEKKKTNKKSEEKEALKAALKDKKEAEKLAKEAEKAAKEASKLALKEKKEAEKKSKKGEKKEVKNEKKVPEEVPLLEKVEEKVAEFSPEEVSDLDVVKKFEYEGVKYLKSKKTGIIYNMEQEVVGKWNEESKKIEFEEEDDSSDEEE
jgi:Skp family chaperone for outer membrane proteins